MFDIFTFEESYFFGCVGFHKGCKVTIESESMKIVKGVLVVMKARKVENLNVLGNTITGGTTMSSVAVLDSVPTQL